MCGVFRCAAFAGSNVDHICSHVKLETRVFRQHRLCANLSFIHSGFSSLWFCFRCLLSSLNAHDHAHSAAHTENATSLLLPALCCLSVFLSHLSSLKQRNRFQFHVFSFHSSICLFLHPPVSILISGNQSAVNNLLNSIDRQHLVSWPAT